MKLILIRASNDKENDQMIFYLIDHYIKNTMDFGDNKLDRFKANHSWLFYSLKYILFFSFTFFIWI